MEGPWSHLLRWQQHDEEDIHKITAALDDMEDTRESDDDTISDMPEGEDQYAEDEIEQPCQTPASCQLSQDAIVNIINERIEHYTNLWAPNKGVPREEHIAYNPEKMWEDAEAQGQRIPLVEMYQDELDYFTRGLDKLCEEILRVPGRNEDEIRRQCNNLEVTIDNMELSRWLMSIYALSPESDGDGIQESNEGAMADQNNLRNPQSTSNPASLTEIIELESPSSSSMGDEEVDLRPNIVTTRVGANKCPTTAHPTEAGIFVAIEANAAPGSGSHLLSPDLPGFTVNHEDEPEYASIATVRRWKWDDLAGTCDRKRIVSKAIHELPNADREDIRTRIELLTRVTMSREIKACVEMILRGECRIHGVLPRDLFKIRTLSNLYMSWWHGDNFLHKTPSRRQLEEITQCFGKDPGDFHIFFDFLGTIMNTTFSAEALRNPERPSQAEIIEISDDEDLPAAATIVQRSSDTGSIARSREASVVVLD